MAVSRDFIRRLCCSLAAASLATGPAGAADLFSENFDGLTLKPVVTFESELRDRAAWQEVGPNGPAGWTEVNLTTVNPESPGSGVAEFAGWRFVDKAWWVLTAGDQGRNQFLSGSGVIAVADPDEWDDFGDPAGSEADLDPANGVFDSTLVTPSISLSGIAANQAKLFFHSSWQPEDQQTGMLTAVYNRGAGNETTIPLLRFSSVDSDPDFKPIALNESVTLDLQNPAGAANVEIQFRLQGNNDWWWAVDNVSVFTGAAPGEDGVLRAIVDRGTGEVKIVNRTGSSVDLRGYSLRSQAGVFDEAGAAFLSAGDPGWLQATQPGGTINDLSEVHLGSDPFGTTAEINLGDVWQGFYRELSDVTFDYLLEGNDSPIRGIVEFVGNPDQAYPFLDLDFSGAVDINDWETFKLGFGSGLTGLTEAVRYAKGDLDNDGLHTLGDFLEFQRTYDFVNGQGALAAAIAGGSTNVPEPASWAALLAICFTAATVRLRGRPAAMAIVVGAALVGVSATDADAQLVLLSEDFEGIPLGPNVEEAVAGSEVWSGVGPAGWIVDDSGMPNNDDPDLDGVTEWSGWAFADKDWWVEAAGDQDRSQFTRGQGTVMIADPDEWEDAATDPGTTAPFNLYDARTLTPVISIPAGVPAGRIKFAFDSAWRPEGMDDGAVNNTNNQTAVIRAIYDAGTPSQRAVEVLRWDSDEESDFYKQDATNERVTIDDLRFDGAASTLQLEFNLNNAWNDWFWALDNLLISVPTDPATLRINTANGLAYLVGDDVISSAITGINITSDTGLLRSMAGGGLSASVAETADGPDADSIPGSSSGERWERLASTDRQFAEAFLFGSSQFDNTRSELLGGLINAATFDQAAAEAAGDIKFSYSLASGDIVQGVVQYYYEAIGLPGDFNGDGSVDAADYTVWRDALGTTASLGGNGDETGGSANLVDAADYALWKQSFGASLSVGPAATAAAGVPEPSSLLVCLLAGAAGAASLARRGGRGLLLGLAAMLATAGGASAALPPSPFLDRDYRFGDLDNGGTAGQPVTQTDGSGNLVTYDSAGQLGQNQLIDLIAVSPTSRKPTYVSTADRPDGAGGIGLQLNPLTFDRQYLRTGFGEALNFPEQSPSSAASLINQGGSLNYFRINDRGFELWAKPTAVAGEQHIVMDSQQHGVLIDSSGHYAMRYGSRFEVETTQLPGPDGELGTEDDVLDVSDPIVTPADYSTGVLATANQWSHLSVVRPFGPGQGSIFYVNGVAEAVAFGGYAVETIVNIGEGEVFTNIDALDVSPLTVGRATSPTSLELPLAESFFFRGVVDDLKMFVIGLNDNDNLVGGGVNVLNDYGEYIFQRDNGYAQAFAPAIDGDLNGDMSVTLADASLFASNWLSEKRLSAINPATELEQSRLVGDLSTRVLGDFNYDGIVNLGDWAILNNASPAAGAAALRLIAGHSVPEPASLLTALSVGAFALLARRARRGGE
ncbi:hypothetical protein Pla175_29200 [Pirellulimonas nuda]|uniref:PEP-CTERM motif protein n=1 Tax=Pirellulimonas nuda TaxID=2528009 RepID=A0A518DDH5_9BACT|nr:hypothetical protein [Pirellulimonas nuda]QDU89528.1 hypothetical protein Pla175_29200 [Pirellulimonas nuda]